MDENPYRSPVKEAKRPMRSTWRIAEFLSLSVSIAIGAVVGHQCAIRLANYAGDLVPKGVGLREWQIVHRATYFLTALLIGCFIALLIFEITFGRAYRKSRHAEDALPIDAQAIGAR